MSTERGTIRPLDGDVAEIVPVVEAAAALLEVIGGRNFGIVHLGGQGGFPIDALQAFDEGIGKNELGVAAALGAAVVVAAARVGQPALVPVEIDERRGRLRLRVPARSASSSGLEVRKMSQMA